MGIQNKRRDWIVFCTGTLLFLLALSNILLWIYVATRGVQKFEVHKSQYLSFFPAVLQNAFLLTVINIVLLGIAFVIFIRSTKIIKYVSYILAIFAGILLMWNVFSLM